MTKWHKYLVVKHTEDQKNCFTMLFQVHNKCMWIEGQPELTYSVTSVHTGSMVVMANMGILSDYEMGGT